MIRLYGERPYALDAHLARLERSAAGLRLTVDLDALRGDVATAARGERAADVLVRVARRRAAATASR